MKNGHGNVEVDFHYTIYHVDDLLYSIAMKAPAGCTRFQPLTKDLRLDTGLLDTFIPLIQANYLDFIDRFEVDPTEALQLQPEDYSWTIYVKKQMIENCGRPDQLTEYRRQEELRKTLESKVHQWMGSQIFHFSHADYVDHAWAASRTVEELDVVEGNHVRAKKQYGTWNDEEEVGYQLYLQE